MALQFNQQGYTYTAQGVRKDHSYVITEEEGCFYFNDYEFETLQEAQAECNGIEDFLLKAMDLRDRGVKVYNEFGDELELCTDGNAEYIVTTAETTADFMDFTYDMAERLSWVSWGSQKKGRYVRPGNPVIFQYGDREFVGLDILPQLWQHK